jgi:hypothetical protein
MPSTSSSAFARRERLVSLRNTPSRAGLVPHGDVPVAGASTRSRREAPGVGCGEANASSRRGETVFLLCPQGMGRLGFCAGLEGGLLSSASSGTAEWKTNRRVPISIRELSRSVRRECTGTHDTVTAASPSGVNQTCAVCKNERTYVRERDTARKSLYRALYRRAHRALYRRAYRALYRRVQE